MSRPSAKTFKELIVWQKAHQWVLSVYRYTAHFPKHELYGLTSQFRRAAVSVPANIAEGFKRRGKTDKARFMNIAQASLAEGEYYQILAQDLGYGDAEELFAQQEEIAKLLVVYTRTILSSIS